MILADMETKEREAYRMRCKHYGVDGMCWKRSSLQEFYDEAGKLIFKGHVNLDCDCDCARMRRYDKLSKDKI